MCYESICPCFFFKNSFLVKVCDIREQRRAQGVWLAHPKILTPPLNENKEDICGDVSILLTFVREWIVDTPFFFKPLLE